MRLFKLTAVTLTALTLGAGAALAKAHDQGVADGDITPGTQTGAKTTIDALEDAGVLDGKGVSAVVKNGQQGAAASGPR
ncbi:hypothetical protein PGB28_08550 [Primorskyibacter aestuariivivens]|uniref:hypothetical protein n=1 Tax=Primorskyibacter aestuariivivens TaxID=1888912 RepID=UPI0023008764|nr:hypothetical protein [Primorskyibacter aestuariivivens]MDA7428508.1 hypothetical protein [Primorskyibacter aestuariivivens]